MADTQIPRGTPGVATNAGLTPQMPLVNADGTPTVFFFRYLLTTRPAAQTRDVMANIPTRLGSADAGQLFTATDYQHTYVWTGSAWEFAAGDASGYTVIGKPDGSPPDGGLWGLCDGSAYDVAQPDGTLASVATQALTAGAFLTGDAPGAAVASAATWAAGAKTDTEAAHTHSIDPPATASGNDSGSIAINVGTGTAVIVASHPHTHSVDVAAFASDVGTAHAHALSNANARLNPPSAANGGLPARVGVRFYIRR
jgi:hypothetical protein